MSSVSTFLWFESRAEEAARLYTSLVKNSQVTGVHRTTSRGPHGPVVTVEFSLDGQRFIAFDGGPVFQFTPATSIAVRCEDQEEIDRLWAGLTEGGEEVQCGWLKDRYGLSWQIVPRELPAMLCDPDPEKSQRTMQALLGMKKLDLGVLRRAYDGS